MTKRKQRDLLEGLSSASEDEQQQARLSKARSTLTTILNDEEEDGVDARAIDKQLIADRLVKAAAESKGQKPFEPIAALFTPDTKYVLRQTLRSEHRGHALTRMVGEGDCVYSADKTGVVIRWRRNPEGVWRKQRTFHMKSGVLALALSPDSRYILAGMQDGRLVSVDSHTNRQAQLGPNGHRAAVNTIAFQPAAAPPVAFSGSADRTIKMWAVDEAAYLDTLFGHQDQVLAIAASLALPDRCVSVGGRDRTLRLWKLADESQLVFRLTESDGGSLDEVVACGKYFVTGSDAGTLSLWTAARKKPIHSVPGAHASAINCLYSPDMSDLVVSSASDNRVRLWRVAADRLEMVSELFAPGHVNGICLDVASRSLLVAVSPENRFGRWSVDPSIKSSILVFSIL